MADTRINLLSTASGSATDDFLPIDGTTNGTRKLSAFSPSFGGNLTVTGTGSFAGVLSTTSAAQRIINTGGAFQIYKDATPSIAARFSLNVAAADTVGVGVYNGTSWTDGLLVSTTDVTVASGVGFKLGNAYTAGAPTATGYLVIKDSIGNSYKIPAVAV